MVRRHLTVLLCFIVYTELILARNSTDENLIAYSNAVYPRDSALGYVRLFKKSEQNDVLYLIVKNIQTGILPDKYLDVKTSLLVQESFKQLKPLLLNTENFRVGMWYYQGEYAIVSVRFISLKEESVIVDFLFNNQKDKLLAINLNERGW